VYGIKLILILIIVGGVIAYIGDKIGMKVGKKRLTLFGLRPKYTSILITICTGILIALMSLGVLVTGSWRVRQALFDMNALLERMDSLSAEVKAKSSELTSLKEEIAARNEELAALTAEKDELEANLTQVEAEYKELQANKQQLENRVEELALQKEDLTGQINNLSHNLSLFGEKYFTSLSEEVIYQKGEVVLAQALEGGGTKEQLRGQLSGLISQVDKASKTGQVKYSQQEFERTLSLLTEDKQQLIVRLLAARNVFQGEELEVKFDLIQNYIVYEADQIIFTTELNTKNISSSTLQLEEIIVKLNSEGIKRGLLPDKRGRAVDISLSKSYSLLNKLQSRRGRIRLKIVASDDIWRNEAAEDKINFQVEEL
jgi:uncharacterized protein (DUF3084 family)